MGCLENQFEVPKAPELKTEISRVFRVLGSHGRVSPSSLFAERKAEKQMDPVGLETRLCDQANSEVVFFSLVLSNFVFLEIF